VVNVPYRREDPEAFEAAFPGRDGLEVTEVTDGTDGTGSPR
jgi:hypothetical protein